MKARIFLSYIFLLPDSDLHVHGESKRILRPEAR